jgi:hypothetical protein
MSPFDKQEMTITPKKKFFKRKEKKNKERSAFEHSPMIL